jgi:hypothetical protein
MKAQHGDEPMDRLTRLAGVARDAIEADPEYEEGDRLLISLNDDDNGGFYASGFSGPAELIVDLLEHVKGMLLSIGVGTMKFRPGHPTEHDMTITLSFNPGQAEEASRITSAIVLHFPVSMN